MKQQKREKNVLYSFSILEDSEIRAVVMHGGNHTFALLGTISGGGQVLRHNYATVEKKVHTFICSVRDNESIVDNGTEISAYL